MYLAIVMFLSTSFYMMQAFVLVLAGATIAIACDRIDCNWGFCIPILDGEYRCVCAAGYTGENCNQPVLRERFARNTNTSCSDQQACLNGGTCIEETHASGDNMLYNDGEVMGETAESDGSDTFVCLCTPEFTGPNCSGNLDTCTALHKVIELSGLAHTLQRLCILYKSVSSYTKEQVINSRLNVYIYNYIRYCSKC